MKKARWFAVMVDPYAKSLGGIGWSEWNRFAARKDAAAYVKRNWPNGPPIGCKVKIVPC